MAGSIFVIKDDKVIELKESKFDNELSFQELIEKYPNILAGDQITPNDPRKWIFISREIGVPAQLDGGNQWFLDHLFIDHESIPTFIEVKRSTDTRIRREVVAQMLDYAANATEYWPIETIRNLYDDQKRNLSEDLDIEPDKEELFWDTVSSNLRLGKIRLLFVADEIPMSLQRIIEFLNNQMTETEVLGLEIKQFISNENLTTLVPKIIGLTSESFISKQRPIGQWDEESFMAAVKNLSGPEAVSIATTILREFEKLGCRIWWGQGKKYASFYPVYDGKQSQTLFSVYTFTKSTHIEIQFQYFREPLNTFEKRKEIQRRLQEIDGVIIPDNQLETRPSFDWSILKKKDNLEKFIKIFSDLIDEIKVFDEKNN